ncbi:MFS transporter [Ruania halotolerans]|uniref:MFS transporter n=1 Tax=Ruania halotolerans TaxID=2897773 RepID=UPI001E33CF7A|nr:MFS transporter [Ruania halotolerans]UFU05898.1 MFS transporter [Ruania halotolerans]
MTDSITDTRPDLRTRTAWAGILVMMATSFVLVVAEFLPPSLLPSMAAALGITEGQAGQAVTVTAFVGLLTAPTIGLIFPRLDRRTLLSWLAVAAAVSNLAVAVSSDFVMLLVARLLLGAAIGGFWAMSLAIAARLSRPEHLGRAVMAINTGTTVATVAGVPAGIYLGSLFDWRVVFMGASVLTVVVAVALRIVLPVVPPAQATGLRSLADTVRTPGVGRGLLGHVLTVLGHFAAFTYVRTALSQAPELDAAAVALLLAVFGFGGVLGNIVVGLLVDKHLRLLRYAIPLMIAVGVAIVALWPGVMMAVIAGIAVWGIAFGAWLTVVATWIARVAPERMEAGGGLIVAGFQLAITIGAGVGGVLVDTFGVQAALLAAAASALVGGLVFGTTREGAEPQR